MNRSIVHCKLRWAVAIFSISGLMAPVAAQPYVYVPNRLGHTVTVIDARDNSVVGHVGAGQGHPFAYPQSITVSPVGNLAYVGNHDDDGLHGGSVTILSGTNILGSISTPGVAPNALALEPRENLLHVVDTHADAVRIVDLMTGAVGSAIAVGFHPYGIAIHPDGSRAYVANRDGDRDFVGSPRNSSISVIDVRSGVVTGSVQIGFSGNGQSLGLSPDGETLYASSECANASGLEDCSHGTVSVIRTSDLAVVKVIPAGVAPTSLAVSPDGNRVYVANYYLGSRNNGDSGGLTIIDTRDYSVTTVASGGLNPEGVAVGSDGTRVYLSNTRSSDVTVFDSSGGIIAEAPAGHIPLHLATAPPAADLAVGVVASQPVRSVGQNAGFGVGVSNSGPNDSHAVRLDLALDTLAAAVAVSAPSGWQCSPPIPVDGSSLVQCRSERLAAGSSPYFSVTSILPDSLGGSQVSLSATVIGSGFDPAIDDNRDSASVQVTASANLRLSFSGPTTPVRGGTTVPVYLRVDNYGPNAAKAPEIVLSSNLPGSAIAISAPQAWSCTVGNGANANGQCSYTGHLGRGTTLLPMQVTPSASMTAMMATLTGSISSATPDPVPENNVATFKLRVRAGGGFAPVTATID